MLIRIKKDKRAASKSYPVNC